MTDEDFMKRAIELSELSFRRLDMPIGCVIVCEGNPVAESENFALEHKNYTEHAEVLALLKASKKLKTTDLSKCTLYTTMEPCPMCSLLLREYRIKRVVFALSSPDMGGYTKYLILIDSVLSQKYPHHFGEVPEIVAGLLESDASKVWKKRKELKDIGKNYRLEKY